MLPFLLAATLAVAPLANPADSGSPGFYARSDDGAQLVDLQFVVSAGTARETAMQNGLAALTVQTLLLGRLDGTSLADRIAAAGGSIDYSVDPGVVRIVIEALPSALPIVSAALARAIATPDTSPQTIAAARAAIGARIDDDEQNPVTVGLEMLRNAYYQGSAGAPAFGTRASLSVLGPADVAAFLAAHYVRGNAFATATGRVDGAANSAAAAVLAAFPAGSEAPPVLGVQAFSAEPKHVVTQREIGVPFVLVGFAAPSLSDADFAGMLVLRSLFEDIAARQSSTTLAPYQRGIAVVYAYDVKPATFAVSINGTQMDPSAGLTVLEAVLKTASSKVLAADVVERYKTSARGEWALEAQTLTDRAWQIGAAVTQGADPDIAQKVGAAIERVTPADLQRLAQAYLQHYTVALVLPRSPS